MITIEHVSFSYPRAKRPLFEDFSLDLEQGKVYGLLGKNGVGKSSLLYLMTGLLTPKRGQILFHQTNVRKRLPVTLRDLFLVPEEFELPAVPLMRYVELNGGFYPRFSKEDMMKYLELFEMDTDVNLGALSMGQKKKVFMSFALATNTAFLIMDEPTNGLDIPGKSQFRKFMAAGMSDEKAMIISTHQVRDVDKILDHVILMDYSKILLNESTARINDVLLFDEVDALSADVIFSQPSMHGYSVMLPNGGGEAGEINLEVLFNATLAVPERITELFHPHTVAL